jgi:hypothetical protein
VSRYARRSPVAGVVVAIRGTDIPSALRAPRGRNRRVSAARARGPKGPAAGDAQRSARTLPSQLSYRRA